MSKPMHTEISCDQLLSLLTDYLDGEAREEVCREIEQHMSECRNCRVVVDTTRRTISLVQTCNDRSLSIPEDMRERLFKRLDLDDTLKNENAV